jgi:hypothetical protein
MGIMAHPVTGNTGSPSLKSLSNMLTPLVFTRTRFRAVAILVVQQNVSNRRECQAEFQRRISARHFSPAFQPSISAQYFSPVFPPSISVRHFSQTFQSL